MMTQDSLQALRQRYSSALYAYFRPINPARSYTQFKQNNGMGPVFHYSPTVSEAVAGRRLAALRRDLLQFQDDPAAAQFLQRRILETELLLTFWRIRNGKLTADSMVVANYLASQEQLYGPLDRELFNGVLSYFSQLAQAGSIEAKTAMAEVGQLVDFQPADLYRPAEATFRHYQRLAAEALPGLWTYIDSLSADLLQTGPERLAAVFDEALLVIGAREQGWKVITVEHGANVLVSKPRRQILIGRHWRPRSLLRLRQVIAHEVGCHVARTLAGATVASDWLPEEGLAIMLEQLCAGNFSYKRLLRYLSVSLAAGLDGQPRTFREVYEVLWRVIVVVGGAGDDLHERAFYETARAFRGGNPQVAGLAYIKDKIYLEENLQAWRQLEAKLLSAAEFRASLIGNHG